MAKEWVIAEDMMDLGLFTFRLLVSLLNKFSKRLFLCNPTHCNFLQLNLIAFRMDDHKILIQQWLHIIIFLFFDSHWEQSLRKRGFINKNIILDKRSKKVNTVNNCIFICIFSHRLEINFLKQFLKAKFNCISIIA